MTGAPKRTMQPEDLLAIKTVADVQRPPTDGASPTS